MTTATATKTKPNPNPLTVLPTRAELREAVLRMRDRAANRLNGPKADAIAIVQREAKRVLLNESRTDAEEDALCDALELLGFSYEKDFIEGVELNRVVADNAKSLDDHAFQKDQEARGAEHGRLVTARDKAWSEYAALRSQVDAFDAESRCILDQRREMTQLVAGNQRWFAKGAEAVNGSHEGLNWKGGVAKTINTLGGIGGI